jgi:hypothetical protein
MQKQHLTDISEKDPNNDVNIATEKNENPSARRVEPSEPSDPSAVTVYQCYYCEERFLSQSELIAHMDKESADARKKQQVEF